MLIFAMLTGIAGYFIYVNIPFLEPTHALADKTVRLLQPLLISTPGSCIGINKR